MLSGIGRAAMRRVGAGASHQSTNRVSQNIWHLQRVGKSNNTNSSSTLRQPSFSRRRSFATAAPATKPKPKTISKAKASTKTKKAAPKKLVKKAVKKKPKKKIVAKPKPKPKKTVLTEAQKERARLKTLKAAALTPPKTKPSTAWLVMYTEYLGTEKIPLPSAAKLAAAKYKSLTTEELERFNHTANQNKIANETAYKEWIESHTPDEIRLANNARKLLRQKEAVKGHRRTKLLEDPRIPKRPFSTWQLFASDRWQSGDFKGIKIADGAAQMSKEFKDLSASQRKSYEDRSAASSLQYTQEFKTVFGRDPQFIQIQQKVAAAA